MTGQLHAYSFINAKLRARIGELLEESFFRSLAGSASVDDAVSGLAEAGFEKVADAYRDTGDVRVCEQVLYRREVQLLLEVERYFDGERREFVAALADRYEVENVKTALRLWFEGVLRGKHVESKIAYLSREPVHRELNLDGIVNASSPQDIPSVLEDTPYADAVSRNLDRVQQSGSLFAAERALDRDYFARLIEIAGRLPRPDREPALSFIALEADRENVSWIIRALNYYGMEEGEALSGLLPGGSSFDERKLREAIRSGRPTSVLLEELGHAGAGGAGSGGREGGREARELELIEAALDEETDRLVHRQLGSYPFTMGVVLAYYVLTQRELRRIAAVLNGLGYGLSADATGAAL
jgi:V/A-type H+-transporting ATPase subunit C